MSNAACPGGKTRNLPSQCPGAEGKEIADKVRSLVLQGTDPHEYAKEQAKYSKDKPRLKLSELERLYNEFCFNRNRPGTIKRNQYSFKKLREYCGNCYVDTINREKTELWITNSKLSKSAINIHLSSCRAISIGDLSMD